MPMVGNQRAAMDRLEWKQQLRFRQPVRHLHGISKYFIGSADGRADVGEYRLHRLSGRRGVHLWRDLEHCKLSGEWRTGIRHCDNGSRVRMVRKPIDGLDHGQCSGRVGPASSRLCHWREHIDDAADWFAQHCWNDPDNLPGRCAQSPAPPPDGTPITDPHMLAFTASPDHNRVDSSGRFLVEGYEADIYQISTSPEILSTVLFLGKPAPDSAGIIHVDLQGALGTPLPAGVTYKARVSAFGSRDRDE